MLEDIVANLANHAETGQIPKPYRWTNMNDNDHKEINYILIKIFYRI